MRFVVICMVIASLSFGACKNEEAAPLPMSEEKIVNLLADIHFARAAAKIYLEEDRDSMTMLYESQVFEIHKIDRSAYEKLLTILESDLNVYYEIEKKVHSRLKTIQNDKS